MFLQVGGEEEVVQVTLKLKERKKKKDKNLRFLVKQ